MLKDRWRVCVFLLGIALVAGWARASEVLSLRDYINSASFNVVYSGDVVPGYLRVTADPDVQVSREQLLSVLGAFDLTLVEREGVLVVVRVVPVVEPTPAAVAFDSPELLPLEEIVVTASLHQLMRRGALEQTTLDPVSIRRKIAVANDGMRLAAQVPGSATADVSARPRFRGGSTTESLILLDGVRLYDPFHMGVAQALFSPIDTRMLEGIEVMTGGFEARYGDRLSGVVVLTPTGGTPLAPRNEVGVGLYNVSYLTARETGRTNWMLGVRRSALELAGALSEVGFGKPTFSDLLLRGQRELASGSLLTSGLFWFGEKLTLNDSRQQEAVGSLTRNTYWWLRHEHERDDGFSASQMTLSYNDRDRSGSINLPGIVSGTLKDNRDISRLSLSHEREQTFEASILAYGATFDGEKGDFAVARDRENRAAFSGLGDTVPSLNLLDSQQIQRAGAWGSFRKRLPASLVAQAGLRFDAQRQGGTTATQISPRLALLYFLPNRVTTLRLGIGRFSQSDHLLELNTADGVTGPQRVQVSEHQIAGLEHSFGSVQLKIEVYKKRGIDGRTYFDNVTNPYSLLPELLPDRIEVRSAGYTARGIDLSIEGEIPARRASWWAAYSVSSARDSVNDRSVRRSWDQTHNVGAGVAVDVRGWQVSLAGKYHTGWPTTVLSLSDAGVIEAAARNTARYRNFASVDLKVSGNWLLGAHGSLRLEAGLTNLLGRANQIGVEFGDLSSELNLRRRNGLPMTPLLDVYWDF